MSFYSMFYPAPDRLLSYEAMPKTYLYPSEKEHSRANFDCMIPEERDLLVPSVSTQASELKHRCKEGIKVQLFLTEA